MFIISDVKCRGKQALKENFWPSILVTVIYSIIGIAINFASDVESTIYVGYVASLLLKFLILNPLEVGFAKFFLDNRDGKGNFMDLFHGFLGYGYFNVVKIMFMRDLKLALYSLTFIVPAIYILFATMINQIFLFLLIPLLIPLLMKSIDYCMLPYIVADDCGIRYRDAFIKTKEMVKHKRMLILLFELSFFGWYILGILTFGILIPYAIAFNNASMAEAYCDLY